MSAKRRVLAASRLVGTIVPLVFAALLGMKEIGWPTEDFGTSGPWRDTIGALAIATVVFGLLGWAAEGLTRRGLQQERQVADLEDLCRLAVLHVHQSCGSIPIDQLGAHVWLVKKKRAKSGRRLPARLETAALFSIRGRPRSPVIWTEGKGAIGSAWRDKAPVLVDLEDPIWELARQRKDPAFNALAEEDRLGMSGDEVRQSDRYRAIGAFPLAASNGDTVLGVFSIDCTAAGNFSCVRQALTNHTTFSDILGTCETLLNGD